MSTDYRRRLQEHIKAMLACGAYKSGDRLPSLRMYAEQFGMTVSTVRNALLELDRAGLVSMRHGDGVYITGNSRLPQQEPIWKIAVFTGKAASLDPANTYSAHALLGVQEEAAANRCRVEIFFRDFYGTTEPLVMNQKLLRDSDACILLAVYDRNRIILDTGIPIIGLQIGELYLGRLSCVSIDPFSTAELARDYFLSRGIRRVKCLYFENGASKDQYRVFKSEFENYGTCLGMVLHDNHPSLELFDDAKTGYLFFCGTVSHMVQTAYEQCHGRAMTDDFCLLSVDGKSRYVPAYKPVPNIGIDWRQAGRMLLTEALFRIHKPELPGRRVLMTPDLRLS